ncbi:hypothetical protein GCM10022243_07230 [Saccharothrix violaceirubra]|uniref:Sirohydrochlorin ferrochelatase n=1 Tax=Saccharothrix violaceirubra TaxID=413306 RepID=A0A7W7T0R0_9PSEU|nr:GGDEF domain-containing protein [Saccharothrix violaceirubra]MBB4963135.1 sirohydrochlorin ferrochelatase [Saccharothrix violaceirubra]
MGVREAVARRSGADRARALRTKWRAASLAAGWVYPADWHLEEVDEVCAAVLADGDPGGALYRLGGARAEAGAGLAETLLDLAALQGVLADGESDVDAVPARLLHATALGWGDVLSRQAADRSSDNPLTGLATGAYLRTRLREVYAEARAGGSLDHVLVLVGLDLTRTSGWSRVVAMTLLADALRTVFDSGETIATVNRSLAAVLLRRDVHLARRLANLKVVIESRLKVDPHVAPTGPAQVWLESLPDTWEEATELLDGFTA